MAKDIVANIMNNYTNKDGLVSVHYPPSDQHLLNHLDDIVPFLLHLGERHFVFDQISRSRKYIYRGLVCSKNKIISYQNNEYLQALVTFYRHTKDETVKKMIDESVESIKRYLVNDGFINTNYDLNTCDMIPVTSPMSGALMEAMLDYYDLVAEESDVILNILTNWTQVGSYEKYGLFFSKYHTQSKTWNSYYYHSYIPLPNRVVNRFEVNFYTLPKFHNIIYKMPFGVKVQITKDNTNLIFCFIEAYRKTHNGLFKEAIGKWIKGVQTHMFEDGFVYRFWNPTRGKRSVELVCNHAVIDILCDAYFFVDNEQIYLDMAEEIASAWMDRCRWPIGLLPKKAKGVHNHLDNQTDFCVALMRLYELTGKEKYRGFAQELIDKVLKYHYTDDGYITSVDIKGEPQERRIEPKYNALLLKPLIVLGEQRRIYSDPYVHQLMKDR
jgi:hypothetical protein